MSTPKCGRPRRRKCPAERDEQRALAQWLDLLRLDWLHVPNEGQRNPRTGRSLKAQGLKPGAPDVLIFDAPRGYPSARGVAIELKALDGDEPTTAQADWLARLYAQGWLTRVCYGSADAIAWLGSLGYGIGNRTVQNGQP